jgi:hypothetical protein
MQNRNQRPNDDRTDIPLDCDCRFIESWVMGLTEGSPDSFGLNGGDNPITVS